MKMYESCDLKLRLTQFLQMRDLTRDFTYSVILRFCRRDEKPIFFEIYVTRDGRIRCFSKISNIEMS